MSGNRLSRGVPLPRLGQSLVLVAAALAAWLLWSESRERGAIPGVAPDIDSRTRQIQAFDALVSQGRDAVPEFLTRLSDSDPKARQNVLISLGRIGPEAADALPAVREHLTDADGRVRAGALSAFSRIVADRRIVAAVAGPMLADPENEVRDDAAMLLQAMGPDGIPAEIAALRSAAPAARREAVRLLRQINPYFDHLEVLEAIRGVLDDSDSGVRTDAIEAVISCEGARADEARAWLDDDDPRIVELGIRAMDWERPEAATALPVLIAIIESRRSDHDPRFDRMDPLLNALMSLKGAAKPAMPYLLRRLELPNEAFKAPIIEALVEIGADQQDLVRLLTPFLHDKSHATWASQKLSRVSPEEARRQVSLLIPQLGSNDTAVDKSVLNLLNGLGAQAHEAVPLLTSLLSNPDLAVAREAAATLGKLGPDAAAAVPELLHLLARDNLDSARPGHRVVEALGNIGPASKDAIPALLEILTAPQAEQPETLEIRPRFDWLRLDVLLALGRIGPTDPKVLAVFRSLLESDSWQDRAAVAEALASPGVEAATVLGDLIHALDDENGDARGNAALAIGELTGDRRSAVAPLAAALRDDDPYVRTAAAIALGKIGPDAADAIESLRDAASDPRNSVPNIAWPAPKSEWLRYQRRYDRVRCVEKAAIAALLKIETQ